MFLTKIKALLKPSTKAETPLILVKQIRASLLAILAPLTISVAPLVMEKIKTKAVNKNSLSYRLRYNLAPVALTIFLVFALTGIGFLPGTTNNRAPTFSVSLAPEITYGGKSNAPVGAPPKTVTPPATTIDNATPTSLKAKSKTEIFFEKIWKFLLTLWR